MAYISSRTIYRPNFGLVSLDQPTNSLTPQAPHSRYCLATVIGCLTAIRALCLGWADNVIGGVAYTWCQLLEPGRSPSRVNKIFFCKINFVCVKNCESHAVLPKQFWRIGFHRFCTLFMSSVTAVFPPQIKFILFAAMEKLVFLRYIIVVYS